MSFSDVRGNDRIKKILRRALKKDRVPNSMLFTGPLGVGKTDMAHVVAKALNCLDKKDDSCEECASCRAFNKGSFPDFMVIEAENNILKIDQMRAMKETAYLKPMIGRKRIFIISEAGKMNEEASNSLLKILEEPPSFSHIIMTSNNISLIIPTILSRCQMLTFGAISREIIESDLVAEGWDPEKARLASVFVQGNYKRAMSIEWDEVAAQKKYAWKLILALASRKGAADLLEEFVKGGRGSREQMSSLLEVLITFYRDILLLGDKGPPGLLINPDFEEEIKKMGGAVDGREILASLQKVEYALYALERNVNIQLLKNYVFSQLMDRNHV